MSVSYRRLLLKKLLEILKNNRPAILAALHADLHKSEEEAMTGEYIAILNVIRYFIANVKSFAKPKRCGVSWMNFPASGRLYPEPYGEVLVVGTWNYPLLLSLEPLAGAIAAGNRVVLKLPDLSGKTTQLISWMIQQTFSDDDVLAVTSELTLEELLNEKFDYIFFTGSADGGRYVMKRGAETLTPVTLELGGKNPCIVDSDAIVSIAARRIAWGKFTNAGQTCLAPDYLLVNRRIKDRFLVELRRHIKAMYGDNPVESMDYPRIISQEHYDRLSLLLEHGRLIAGGDKNPDRLSIAPTVIDGVGYDDPVMEKEIFGPILPVLEFSSEEDLLLQLSNRPKPLALYYFGRGSAIKRKLCALTSSGSICFNDVVMQFINSAMPFGGVGESGCGAYHGKYTFDTFTHYKPVMDQISWLDIPMRYPPFSAFRKLLLKMLSR